MTANVPVPLERGVYESPQWEHCLGRLVEEAFNTVDLSLDTRWLARRRVMADDV